MNIAGLVIQLRRLMEAVCSTAVRDGGGLRKVPWHVFGRASGAAVVSELTLKEQIVWPEGDVREWISRLAPYSAVAEILRASQHFRRWIPTRLPGRTPHTSGTDAVLELGIKLFVHEFILSVLDPTAWRVLDEQWDFSVAAMRSLLSDGKVTYAWLGLLCGVGVTDEVRVDDLVLRGPTQAELMMAYNISHFETADPNATLCSAVVEATELVDIGTQPTLSSRISAVITALRVWTASPITLFASFQARDSRRYQRVHRLDGTLIFTFPVHLDSEGFREFWIRSRGVLLRPPNALAVAIRRINLMVDQERGSDRVLDLCIILEALFQLGDEKTELSYRLSMRTAHFVGMSPVERRDTFDTVKAGYGLRSKIAHGSVASADDTSAQENLERVVFQALRKYCDHAASFSNNDAHKAIVKELDGYMLERSNDSVTR